MTDRTNALLRFLVVLALLAGTALFIHSHSQAENLPPRMQLTELPLMLGNWSGTDVPISDDVREILGPGNFVQRVYRRASEEPYVDLFLAYFPTQRTGATVHSPQNCLPGAGWVPVESGRIHLPQPDGRIATVNRYVIAKGSERQLVVYWYQAHARITASEYWAKFYLVADSIRLNRSDGALVRVITPLVEGEEPDKAQQRATEFLRDLTPILSAYIPN